MGIKKVKCFQAICDKCKKEFVNSNDFSVFLDEGELIEQLVEDEWGEQDGELICFDCIDYDKSLDDYVDIKASK